MGSKKNLVKSKVLYDSESDDDDIKEEVENDTIITEAPSLEQTTPSNKDAICKKVKKEKPQHICSNCNKVFARKWFLDRHIDELRCNVIREKTKEENIKLKAIEMKEAEKQQKKMLREERKKMKDALEYKMILAKEKELKRKKDEEFKQPTQPLEIVKPIPIKPTSGFKICF